MATQTTPDPAALNWGEPIESMAPRPRGRGWLAWVVLGFIVALVAATGVAYALRTDQARATDHRQIPQKVTRGPMVITVTEDGNVESSSNIDVKCEVAGGSTILWLIKDGTKVEEGDELVKLDSSAIEESVNQQKIAYEKARAAKIEAEKQFSASKIAVQEFEEGTFVQQMQDAIAKITIALENLRSSENSLQHTERMARKGYVTSLQREAQAFAVERAKLDLASARTAKDVLERFTKPKTIEDLVSKRDTAEAKMRSEEAAFELEEARLKRLQTQLDKCVIRAPHAGMVVYANEPGGRPGQQAVQIEEGAGVRERQSIIRLPDLAHMQVKVTVHESKVDQLRVGLRARIRIQDRDFQGQISSVANQAEPTGWFSSNVKEYATIVRIDGESSGLRPGMTAVVEILVADLRDVLSVPVEAVVEQGRNSFCWVLVNRSPERRPVVVGLSSSTHVEIKDGLSEGDEVILNPRAVVPESREEIKTSEPVDVKKKFGDAQPVAAGADAGKRAEGRGRGGERRMPASFAELDKNGDKKITKDEAPERMQAYFDNIDTNGDGGVDQKEYAAMLARMRQMQAGGGPPGGPGGP